MDHSHAWAQRQKGAAGGPQLRKSGGPELRKSGGTQLRKLGGSDQRKFCTMTKLAQSASQIAQALRRPQQRSLRIAAGRWFHQTAQIVEQRRIIGRQRLD